MARIFTAAVLALPACFIQPEGKVCRPPGKGESFRRALVLPLALVLGFPARADSIRFEDFCYHPATNTELIWDAPTNHLPRILPRYIAGPRIFSTEVISNAIGLTPFRVPENLVASTNLLNFSDSAQGCGARHLMILPAWGQISYRVPGDHSSPAGVPNPEAVSKLAWDCASRLGLDLAEMLEKPESRVSGNCEAQGSTNQVCSRSTFLTRKVNGIELRDLGFAITFGSDGEVRGFGVLWPDLTVGETAPLAAPEQIIRCIRAHKAPLALIKDGGVDWAKLKALTTASRFTITKVTPIYGEGKYGEMTRQNDPDRIFSPYAELEAIAQLDHTNVTVQLLAPILSGDATRLLSTGE